MTGDFYVRMFTERQFTHGHLTGREGDCKQFLENFGTGRFRRPSPTLPTQ